MAIKKAARSTPVDRTKEPNAASQRRAARKAAEPVDDAKPERAKVPGLKIPKKLAEAADAYFTARNERLALEKKVNELKEREVALKDHLIDNLPKSQAGGIAGKLARVEITKRNVPRIDDAKKFWQYAHRKGNEDLFKESLVESAVKSRWEAGKTVPGVEPFTIVSLSVSKLK